MHYFITYMHRDGHGNTSLTIPKGFESYSDIEAVQNGLEKKHNLKNVLITNYIKFEGE